MDFDEYDYLEKAVEETNGSPKGSPEAEKERERSDKGYRRRDRSEDDELDEDEKERRSSSKKSRNGDSSREREKDKGRDVDRNRERERDRDRDRERDKDRDRDRERSSRHRSGERDSERERRSSREKDKERERDRDRGKERKERDGEKEKERERRDRDKERERERRSRSRSQVDRDGERERRSHSRSRLDRDRERDVERRSRSRSRLDRERERELLRDKEREESRRFKDKREAVEPEADPERDQRTVFVYQMPLKATERDAFEFFSQAGKVRDVKLIMDRNSRRSKGVGYIEFYDAMSVPMAIALSGHLFLGQPVMVKPSEAEKNLVQSNTSAGGSVTGPYGATDRKLYVGNLHFNMTEFQLRQIFEAFGPVELVQLPTDPETGHCKGFGFVQFGQLEHAKAAQSLNGKLDIAGRTIKVSSVTDHVGVQDSGTKTADFDDDDGGGLALNAQSRAMLMAKLDRSGIASSVVGTLGVPAFNGAAPSQQSITMPINPTAVLPNAVLPAQVASMAPEPIGTPSECLLLKNMFDPATESDPEFDLDIRDDVQEECSKYGRVKHAYVDKNSAGYVYLRFESVEAASRAQQAMHKRWFARRLISAIFLQPYEYDAKFKGAP
ncbi:RNA-binding protein 39 isoform X2 [Salvia hispanica]|uniref:RNA-binding protein 39 isoform X2 n=1 Tax=Salvia hispanica TaxID=49212 RepID=UPI002009DA7C|nr:RNA-binding protein 39 isoform X2 [Salvia hispanica]